VVEKEIVIMLISLNNFALKEDLKEIEWNDLGWIIVIQDRDR
jgi:hypothetical protein